VALERDELDLGVVGETAPLVGEDGVGDADVAEGEAHPERLAPVEQADDLGVRLPLGLGVPVAVEGGDEGTSAVEVELAHLVGTPEVHVDRALVDRRVGPGGLRRAEQLPRGDVDDREGLRGGGAQRDVRCRVAVRPSRDIGVRRPP
jgi:hypothetical protein